MQTVTLNNGVEMPLLGIALQVAGCDGGRSVRADADPCQILCTDRCVLTSQAGRWSSSLFTMMSAWSVGRS